MADWLTITPRLQQGLKVANQVDSSKFRLLVNRICEHLQTESRSRIFSEEEEEKLMVSLDLSQEDLSLLLDTLLLIYKQAACNLVKPSSMESFLKSKCDVLDDKLAIFSNAWMTYGKGIIDCFRQQSIFPVQVKDIDWSLNMQVSSSMIPRDARPVALLQLGLTGEKDSKVTVEFNKQELVDLYESLEKVQKQLDSLK